MTGRSTCCMKALPSENVNKFKEKEKRKKARLRNKSQPYYHITANKTQIKKSNFGEHSAVPAEII